jgi:hypothetical protein
MTANLKKQFHRVSANNLRILSHLLKPWTIVHGVYIAMKAIFYFFSMLLLGSLTAIGQTKTTAMEAKPVTCKLTTPELQARKAAVIAELKAIVVSRKELPNGFGYEFEGTDETLDRLNSFIKTERMCCDFFTFQLTVEDNKAELNITGPEGAKEFLKEEVDL